MYEEVDTSGGIIPGGELTSRTYISLPLVRTSIRHQSRISNASHTPKQISSNLFLVFTSKGAGHIKWSSPSPASSNTHLISSESSALNRFGSFLKFGSTGGNIRGG